MVLVLSLGLAAVDAEAARRLGGGKSSGMQRQNTTQPAQQPAAAGQQAGAPAQAAPAAAAAPGAAAAAAPRRSWMGPIAGLAAGLGLAALASHFGFGEALANMLMIGLLVMAALALVGFFLRKRAMGQQPAALGAAGGLGGMMRQPPQAAYRHDAPAQPQGGSLIGSRIGSGLAGGLGGTLAAGTQASAIPADFDKAGFERNAKAQFVALQDANDARDLERLRGFLTPEMFELVRADLATRGDAPQKTEVFGLQAQVLEVAQEDDRYVVSVRFTGSVRDEQGAAPEDLDEIWHLTKSRNGFDGWVIAGIQQAGAAG
ncbi:MAG TPA: Tim44-like domain-containing protein [Ramlibacter sp.]|uniref:Tim44 domain-containing protein n=1 Tax=Ramlibacter sp. TaxID=1917967 RepID=UPI002D4DCA96|nr:Tim44-like domain-containing protein [Ramlibacter sp.]HZY18448.1 Tim44-like domain-containing protein [Ramlibacter sp.]